MMPLIAAHVHGILTRLYKPLTQPTHPNTRSPGRGSRRVTSVDCTLEDIEFLTPKPKHDGSQIPNKWKFDIPFTTDAGHSRQATFQDAPVMFPIIALGGATDAGNTVTLKTTYGLIVDDDTGETDTMKRRYGVFGILMTIDDERRLQPQQDFHEAGKT